MMDVNIFITAAVSVVATSTFFSVKRYYDVLDSRRKAASKFLARINECLVDAKISGNGGNQCVCQDSFAEFRLTLSGARATELERCWNDYIRAQMAGVRCVECLECLHRLVHKFTKSGGKESVPACPTCAT